MTRLKPNQSNLPARLTYWIMSELEQAIRAQGIEFEYVPYTWKTIQDLEERVTRHVEAITQDFHAVLQDLTHTK